MRFDYLTDDSTNSLAPFFSRIMISMTFNSVWILGLVALIFWPTKDLFTYFKIHSIPLTFLVVFVAALLINAYLGVRSGRGEVHRSDYFTRLALEGVITPEEKNNFFSYGLIAAVLHTLLLLAVVLPFLIISAAISGISLPVFAKSLSVIFTTALVCRLFAFMTYLAFGRWSLQGYLLSRGFLFFFIFGTAAFASFANPIMIIYAFYQGKELPPYLPIDTYGHYMLLVSAAILLLILVNQAMIGREQEKVTEVAG